jgi:hypothetical protein
MKFDTLEKDVKIEGDIKTNNVSIDTSNINFIVTILSTNLYSKPIESFIRETVSNAWDSHVEAGITEPVILELGKDTEGKYFCRIQDFGVGLSPERFDKVYKNIGSSTKRGDNNQIGGFGIGRFSALAYNDVVHITSNYDGVQYKYIMYKDGNSLSIDLLHSQETDERNGLEVQVELKGNYNEVSNFYEAIKKQLVYFENLYFIDNTTSGAIPENEFNEFHIKKYNNFLVNDLDKNNRQIDLVLGKVRYPLRLDSLTKKYPNYISTYPVTLKFEIGDLEVTPNREELLYSQKNVDKIEVVLDETIKELDVIFEKYSNKDFTSLTEYVEGLNHSHQAPLLEVDGENKVYININSNELKITFNKQKFSKGTFLKTYNFILQANIIPTPYEFYGNKIAYNSGSTTNINAIKQNLDRFYIGDASLFNNMTKNYVKETFSSNSRFIHSNKSVLSFYKKYLKAIEMNAKNYSYNYDYRTIKTIFNIMLPNILNIKKFSEKNVPKSFIDRKKAEEKAKRALRKNNGTDWSENLNISNLRKSDRGYNQVTTTSDTYSLTKIKEKYRKQTVYSDKDDKKLRTLFNLLINVSNVQFVEVALTRQKLLKNFQNFVKLEDFMSVEYKLIRQVATAKLIEQEIPYINKLRNISNSLSKISTKLHDVVMELSDYNKKYLGQRISDQEKELINEIFLLSQKENYFDEVTRGVLNENLTMLKNAEALLLLVDESSSYNKVIPESRINLAVDYVLARKLFRPDVSAVVKLKKETILNIKDESN